MKIISNNFKRKWRKPDFRSMVFKKAGAVTLATLIASSLLLSDVRRSIKYGYDCAKFLFKPAIRYTVQKGDTIDALGYKEGITKNELYAWRWAVEIRNGSLNLKNDTPTIPDSNDLKVGNEMYHLDLNDNRRVG